MGHISNFMLAFLLYPIARNSMWEYVFGVPFERAVKYHRQLGVFAFLCVLGHAGTWYYHWIREGTLRNNLWTVDHLIVGIPTNTTAPNTFQHYDNFTIPFNQISLVGVAILVLIAAFRRRVSYELFYYSHVAFAILFYIAALVHAWDFWY